MVTLQRHTGRVQHTAHARTLATAAAVLVGLVLAACASAGAADASTSTSLVTNYQRVCSLVT